MITLDFKKLGGLVPAIAQDHVTGEVLMLGFMNEAAWEATLKTGQATYFSRSRNSLWVKGETSGNVQLVREITGHRSCFHKMVEDGAVRITGAPVFDPREVYKK